MQFCIFVVGLLLEYKCGVSENLKAYQDYVCSDAALQLIILFLCFFGILANLPPAPASMLVQQ